NDLGSISADTHGRLVVFGRADDVIITGGVNVHPAAVEATMRELPEVGDCVVVGLPSPEWGAEVAAVVVPREPSALRGEDHLQRRRELLDAIRANARSALSAAAAPRALIITMRLPTRGPGKGDRRAAADLAWTVLAAGGGVRHECELADSNLSPPRTCALDFPTGWQVRACAPFRRLSLRFLLGPAPRAPRRSSVEPCWPRRWRSPCRSG